MANRKKKRQNFWQRLHTSITKALHFRIQKRYVMWALLCITVVLILNKHTTVTHWLGGIDWVILKDYLSVLVTWPVAVLILGLVFMYKFTDSIREFLRKIDRFKAPGIEMSQQQAANPPTPNDDKEQKAVEDLESKVDDGSVTLTKPQVDELVSLFETMEFRFLNLHLVPNTKNALRLMTQVEVRKSAFLQVYQVPSQVVDLIGERQAILNSLHEAQLIYEDGDVLRASDKGIRFLAFIGIPVQ